MGDVRVSEDVVEQVVQTAVVRPGDTLIVNVAQKTSPEQAQRISEAIGSRLPGVEVLVTNAVRLAVYRPEVGS